MVINCKKPFDNFIFAIDIVWSDPEDIESGLWAMSPRGAGYLFGSKITAEVHFSNFFILI